MNSHLSRVETVKKFTVLPKPFSIDTGELTPTLKVKRKLCSQRFKAQLDALYEGDVAD